MWKMLPVLAKWIHIPVKVLHAVAQMEKAFHVLYIFEFNTPATKKKLEWYTANIVEVYFMQNKSLLINFTRYAVNTENMRQETESPITCTSCNLSQHLCWPVEACGNIVVILRKHCKGKPKGYG
jgi:hypothetical protein